ncbi:MAG: hypothetical protein DHS20C10_09780 [marine bacterium B5-7]|nr:MAG: hypothetical protein DHS20C10_09780 [marine bacterium B5-7]
MTIKSYLAVIFALGLAATQTVVASDQPIIRICPQLNNVQLAHVSAMNDVPGAYSVDLTAGTMSGWVSYIKPTTTSTDPAEIDKDILDQARELVHHVTDIMPQEMIDGDTGKKYSACVYQFNGQPMPNATLGM